MKKIISIVFTCIMMIALVGCGGNSKNHEGEAKTPSGSSIQKGKDYNDVVDEFKSKGFRNIKEEKIEDLITGWITKDGEVKEVSVGGDVDYSEDEWISADTEVIVKYHTFKEKDTVSAVEPVAKEDVKKEEVKVQDIFTVENSEDLKKILNNPNPSQEELTEFAAKYSQKKIEFDGSIDLVGLIPGKMSRLEMLFRAGNYDANHFSGPTLKIKDFCRSDQGVDKMVVDGTLVIGQNIHIIATVSNYDKIQGILFLDIVSVSAR